MKTPPKKLTRHLVNFETPNDLEAVVLAKLGMSTFAICERTALSPCQVTYRLSKGKTLEGYVKGHTYRSDWRNGTGAVARDVINAMLPMLRKEVKATLPKLVVHPTPETVQSVDFSLTPEVKKLARAKVA